MKLNVSDIIFLIAVGLLMVLTFGLSAETVVSVVRWMLLVVAAMFSYDRWGAFLRLQFFNWIGGFHERKRPEEPTIAGATESISDATGDEA